MSNDPAPVPQPEARKRRARGIGIAALVTVVALVALLAAIWDWNWFRAPISRMASARLHREVTLAGDLHVSPWGWQPSATLADVRIANPAWAPNGRLATFERITLRTRWLPLLWGRLDILELRLDRPDIKLLADGRGRKTWDFSDGRDQAPLKLPPIRNFSIHDGRIAFRDVARQLEFAGTLNASERLGGRERGFDLTGQGRINAAPFRVLIGGGPLVNIQRDKPYPFSVDVRAGQTTLTAEGSISRPFDFGGFELAGKAQGPDMAALFPLIGVAMPNTPPYALHGRLARQGAMWRVTSLGGRVGDSDLAGGLSVDTAGKRPFLRADLTSNSLDFDDLGALFGGAPAVGPGETASAEQVVMHRSLAAQHRIFPDSHLDVTRIRAMDADVSYAALSVRDAPVKLASLSVRLRLNEGLLRADPLRLDLSKGRVEGVVQLDARKATPVTSLDLKMSNARLEQLIPVQYGGVSPVTGPVAGRAWLSGAGDSLHKAFANADGEVMVVASNGEIRKGFAELLGVNVLKGLGLLLSKDQQTTPIRCAIVRFQARGGVMHTDNLLFDTGPVQVVGQGTVNLDTERVDLNLRGHDKKFRLLRLRAPITVTGPLTAPKPGVDLGSAVAQGGVALGIGALLTPLAALLPFVDAGLAKDANCSAVLVEARQQGVPALHARAR